MASCATPLDFGWVRGKLPCTKAGMRGQPHVQDLTRVLQHNGASFSKLTIVEAAERLAPLWPAVFQQLQSFFGEFTVDFMASSENAQEGPTTRTGEKRRLPFFSRYP